MGNFTSASSLPVSKWTGKPAVPVGRSGSTKECGGNEDNRRRRGGQEEERASGRTGVRMHTEHHGEREDASTDNGARDDVK
eukprot:66697-Rhodomonas_salina.1